MTFVSYVRGARRPLSMIFAVSITIGGLMAATTGAGAAAPDAGWLRVGHFAMGDPAVDVYVDGNPLAPNIGFQQVTPYTQFAPGTHTVALRPAGSPATSAPIAIATPSVVANSASTVAAVSSQGALTASVYQDDLSAPPPGQAKVRVIDTVSSVGAVDVFVAPTAPAAEVTLSNVALSTPTAAPAFAALPFGAASPYAGLPAGSYDVQLRAVGTGVPVLSAHSWPVQAGTVASIVVFTGPQGVTLEVLRDAAGSSAAPVGAMATGAGGTAHHRNGGLTPALALALAVLVAAGVAVRFQAPRWILARTRRERERPSR